MARITREKFKTYEDVFDMFTEKVLAKLVSQGHFEELESPVSIGKEANVFIGKHDENPRIVKIYRLETCDFNKMYQYIRTDPRYAYLSGHRRKVIFAWTQREYRNLLKARMAGARVPTPFAFRSNVLLEEFIGSVEEQDNSLKYKPAPKLKDVDLDTESAEKMLSGVLEQMRILAKNGMVHGDLSAFNILVRNNLPVIIDMSQSTTVDDPQFEELLLRDCRNVVSFFSRAGIEVPEEESLFKELLALSRSS
ncbi:serine protein kinase RIO [Candidatus Woesearchaeota archaeon]|nr:MAG: serine protein kinase RIO [Candidatus Woesearchaeota archaeon]